MIVLLLVGVVVLRFSRLAAFVAALGSTASVITAVLTGVGSAVIVAATSAWAAPDTVTVHVLLKKIVPYGQINLCHLHRSTVSASVTRVAIPRLIVSTVSVSIAGAATVASRSTIRVSSSVHPRWRMAWEARHARHHSLPFAEAETA